ncbi:GDSL-type esterase/lipase family protein [Anaeromusa sp.]|uniref:GDSL-type esterase/lipase family protein n=1 Tax=Anaeromusa sp. TaxID=1872520 RepID=UPI002B21E8BB|nr:GDSL-type esterase/lipase family protein [Anaeromusa sp.]
MGDSITWNTNTEIAPIAAKWMTLIQGRIEITAYNQGISGQQTSTMVQNFATTVLAYKPDICFLEEACNDALWWRDGNGTMANIKNMAEQCLSHNIRPIIMCPTPGYYGAYWGEQNPTVASGKNLDWEGANYMPLVRTLEKQYCAEKGITFVDLFTPFLNEDGTQNLDLFAADKLHPNTAGNAVIYNIVCGVLGLHV